MALLPIHFPIKLFKKIATRIVHAIEWGLEVDGTASQTAKLKEIIDDVAGRKDGGRGLGPIYLHAGTIPLATQLDINNVRGMYIQGAGATKNKDGPRDHGGWSNITIGTSLYWTGSSGGTVIEVRQVSNLILRDFDIFLAEDDTADLADVGILWTDPLSGTPPNQGYFGQHDNGCDHIAIVAPDGNHGGTGMQFGATSDDHNVDTVALNCCFFLNLDTGIQIKHEQGLSYALFFPSFKQTNTCIHYEEGGRVSVFHLDSVFGRQLEDMIMLRADAGGTNPGGYMIQGGWCDRQGSGIHIVFMDLHRCKNTAQGTVRGVGVADGDGNTKWDGTRPGALEVGHRNLITCDDCKINGQPLVRFRTSNDTEKIARVVIRGTTMSSGRALGGEIVTCNEGGYAGQVFFEHCQRGLENFSGSVGALGGPGNSMTHKDDESDGNADVVNGYGAWPSADPDEFYDSTAGTGSWLGVTYNATKLGYWRCDDAIGATSLKDLSGNGNDISVQSGVQLEGYPPLPYLAHVADWTQNNGTGVDTTIDLDADGDFTVFGFFWIDDFAEEQVLFSIEPTSGTRLYLGNIDQNRFMRHETSTGSGFGVSTILARIWTHFVFTWSSSDTEIRTHFSGVRHDIGTNSSFKDVSGKFVVGGGSSGGIRPFRGRFCRIGLIEQSLSDKEATLLFLRSSTAITQEYFRF